MFASVIGLRANATAIEVPSSRRSVCSAATTRGRNGSCVISALRAPSYPRSSSARADAPIAARSVVPPPAARIPSIFISRGRYEVPVGVAPPRYPPPRGCLDAAVAVAELDRGVQGVPTRVQVLVRGALAGAALAVGEQGHARAQGPRAADAARAGRPHP